MTTIDEALHISVIVTAVLVLLVLIFVGLRVYVRVVMTRAFSWDDGLLLMSTACYITMSSIGWASNALGNINVATPEVGMTYLKYWMLELMFYLITTALLKLSISVFLLRLAVRKSHTIMIYLTALAYTASAVSSFLALVFDCRPIQAFWDKTLPGAVCLSQQDFYIVALTNAIFCTITDVVFAVLPAWIIWDVQMDKKTKISVTLILGMGLFSCAATIVRLQYLHDVVFQVEFTTTAVFFATWSNAEPAVALIAASLTSMRSLLKKVLRKMGITQGDSTWGTKGTAPTGTWSKKPSHNGYIISEDSKVSDNVRMRDLDPRMENGTNKNLGIVTNIARGSPLPPTQPLEKTWGVTRVDQWNVSEESLSPTRHNAESKYHDVANMI